MNRIMENKINIYPCVEIVSSAVKLDFHVDHYQM